MARRESPVVPPTQTTPAAELACKGDLALPDLVTDEDLLLEMLDRDDGPALLSEAVSQLTAAQIDPRLALWLAGKLVKIQAGEAAAELFRLSSPSGRRKGFHKGFTIDQLAAATAFTRRKCKLKADADSVVAAALGLDDMDRIRRLYAEGGFKKGQLDKQDDQLLMEMIGTTLLAKIDEQLQGLLDVRKQAKLKSDSA